MVAYSALEELVPLYPVYALLFADTGLSPMQIASLFVVWSLVGVLAEVPTGVLADRISRRLLLTVAPLFKASGFLVWVLAPGYPTFVAGFVLWGLGSALVSGTFEAFGYDELDRMGAADRYPALRARSGAAEPIAVAVATLSAAPLLHWGGYVLLGFVSAASAVAQVGVARTLPRGTPPAAEEHESYLATLRAGLHEAVRNRPVRRLVLVSAGLIALLGVDEYIPLLLRAAGAGDSGVALLYTAVPLATAAGMLVAERAGARASGSVLLGAAVAVALAAAAGGPLAGVLTLACWYGAVHLGVVVSDIRLQQAIEGTARATVTSVGGVGAELATIAVFLGYGAAFDQAGTGGPAVTWLLVLGAALPSAVLAAFVRRS